MWNVLKKLFAGGDAVDAKKMIAEGALVIDVRRIDEWNGGHLSVARHIPVDELAARLTDVEQWTAGDKNKPIVVYCASGMRSARAQTILTQAGFSRVVNGGGYGSLR